MKARLLGTLVSLCALALLGCGPTMESPTEIQTLRILGVQKDKPYAVPGDDVTLTMLWHDGSPAGEQDAVPGDDSTRRKVQIGWLAGCLNPPGDTYSGCYRQFAAAASGNGSASIAEGQPLPLPGGSKFTLHIPTDAENGAPVLHPSPDPKLPQYGLSYVFFVLCAGKIVTGDEHFPIHCHDDYGHELGPDDFVVGYSAIYFFAPEADGSPRYVNHNPVNDGLYFGLQKVADDALCKDEKCLGTCEVDGTGCVNPPDTGAKCDETSTLCIPRCPDDGDPNKCPSNDLQLIIDPTRFEKDQVTNDAYGRDYGEQMWIDYYATGGKFRSATKLLNDATSGFNRVNGTQYYAPNVAGDVQLWVVMHDNRGGVSWVGTTLSIQ